MKYENIACTPDGELNIETLRAKAAKIASKSFETNLGMNR